MLSGYPTIQFAKWLPHYTVSLGSVLDCGALIYIKRGMKARFGNSHEHEINKKSMDNHMEEEQLTYGPVGLLLSLPRWHVECGAPSAHLGRSAVAYCLGILYLNF